MKSRSSTAQRYSNQFTRRGVRWLGLLFFSILALLCFTVSEKRAWAGSPFYLTVERSFSSQEKAQVRLDFTKTKVPMVIRILRPKNMEKFLEGQLNISRAYEEPLSSINPGHYILEGFNKVSSPLSDLRNALSEDFRESFGGNEFNGALHYSNAAKIVSSPKEITDGPPAGFEVEREMFIDLQKGGEIPEASNWFWDDEDGEGSYKIRTIELDPVSDGVYLIQAVQGKNEAQSLLQVSSLSVQVKQSSSQFIVRVIDRELRPVAGARITYRDSRGKWLDVPEVTDQGGEVRFNNLGGLLDGKLLVRVSTADSRQALTETDFLTSSTNDNSVFLITDRPIFKPGESFFFKGILRSFDNGELRIPDIKQKTANISLFRTDGSDTGMRTSTTINDFGSFSGSFGLDELQTPGLYRVVAEVDGKPYGGEFRVKDYVKPKFYLEIPEHSPILKPGEVFQFHLKAKAYSGVVPEKVQYETFVYRKRYEVPQFVVESGGGLNAGVDYFGEIRAATALSQPQRIYSSVETRFASQEGGSNGMEGNSWVTAPFLDEKGEADISIQIPKGDEKDEKIEWVYTIVVRAQDASGALAVTSENVYSTLSDAVVAAKFKDTVVPTGRDEAPLLVRSTYPNGDAAPRGTGNVHISLESASGGEKSLIDVPFEADERGIARVQVHLPTNPGRIRAVAELTKLGSQALKVAAKSEPALLLVGGADGSAIIGNQELELVTESTLLNPGEKKKILALLPEGWGNREAGVIWSTIAGTKIYESSSSQVQGRSRWIDVEAKPEYGTGFYQTVTVPTGSGKFAEQTVGFRIVPEDKRLSIRVLPSAEVAEPLKDFVLNFEVKDSLGKPASDAELSVNIVDKAVYAVQSEFRPEILDFFYPLPRLNLATFYSDELQGYGYADEIKHPNFRLSALKSRSQPAKRSMRDTAGWFPHVVTNAEGKATVTVDMPANITEWIVTVVAADKHGKVGEAHGKFRSASEVNLDATVPQFLREGDEATGQIEASTQLGTPVDVALRPASEGNLILKSGSEGKSLQLQAEKKETLPVALSAKIDSHVANGLLSVSLATAKEVKAGGTREFDVSVLPRSVQQNFDSELIGTDGVLKFNAPSEASVQSVNLHVTSGILGAALVAASRLVTYPYGCTEQLAHTTIPNLALLDLLQKTGIAPEKQGFLKLEQVRNQAARNAEIGIQKIIGNQKAGGGFSLWPSDKEPSFAVTLIAMKALKIADDLKIPGAERAYNGGMNFLATSIEATSFSTKNALDGYQLVTLAELRYLSPVRETLVQYVNDVVADKNARLDQVVNALRILKAVEGQWWITSEMKIPENSKNLLSRLAKLVKQFDETKYLKEVSENFDELGFGFGRATLVSSALGTMRNYQELPPDFRDATTRVILSSMRDGMWYSTFETGQVILNTLPILRDEAARYQAEALSGRKLQLLDKGGKLLSVLEAIPGGYLGALHNVGDIQKLTGARLDSVKTGERAYAQIEATVPYAAVKTRASGISVSRRLLKITPSGTVELYPGEPIHLGDIVVSELSVSREGEAHYWGSPESSFVVAEDGIPALGQGIEEDRTYLADAKLVESPESYWAQVKDTQRFPERTVRVLKLAPGGAMKLFQVWRAAFSGKAALPPAQAYDMYNSEVQGNSIAGEVIVQ